MNSGSWSLEPISQDNVLVIVALAIVAILAVLTVIGMVVGARNRAKRRAAEQEEQTRLEELRADGVEATGEAPAATAAPSPAATPAPAHVAPPPPPARAPVARDAEVAPGPSPATPDVVDEPIAAAGPLDASPASVAVDAAPAEERVPVTQLKGLGPKIATRLSELGITHVGQLAWLDDQEAADLDAQLGPFQGRMERDRWREQARLLADGDREGFERAFGRLG